MILRGNYLSETLRMSTNIQMFIPNETDGPYRIVYLLHGLHGDQGTWLDNTMLPVYAKKYNYVFVMPEAGRSFYLNLKYGRKYFDYVSAELPGLCRRIFNISAKREDTAVMGCSMGAYGALSLGLSRPEQYGFIGAISPACLYFRPILESLRKDTQAYRKTGPEAEETLADLYAAYGEGLEYRKDCDIAELVRDFPLSGPKPKIYACCGTEDKLREENLRFKDEIMPLDFDFTYEEWKGGHEWVFFNEALERTLDYWQGSGKE